MYPSEREETMSANLTENAREWAAQKAAREGFPNVEAFMDSLVMRARHGGDWLDDLIDGQSLPLDEAARSSLRQRVRDRVVALLEEGVASGPSRPMTPGDWDELRRE